MPRPKLNALPQDSVLRAHLRRQADWPDDASRLVRSDQSRWKTRDLNDAVERIGRANRLKAEAEALRASAERAGYAMQPEVATEIERLERSAATLVGQAAPQAATPASASGKAAEGLQSPRFRRRGWIRGQRP